MDILKKVYFFLYLTLDQGNITSSEWYQKCLEVICNNNQYGSNNSKNLRSYAVAYWYKDGGEIAKYNEYDTTPSLGIILYFLKHSIINALNVSLHIVNGFILLTLILDTDLASL